MQLNLASRIKCRPTQPPTQPTQPGSTPVVAMVATLCPCAWNRPYASCAAPCGEWGEDHGQFNKPAAMPDGSGCALCSPHDGWTAECW